MCSTLESLVMLNRDSLFSALKMISGSAIHQVNKTLFCKKRKNYLYRFFFLLSFFFLSFFLCFSFALLYGDKFLTLGLEGCKRFFFSWNISLSFPAAIPI